MDFDTFLESVPPGAEKVVEGAFTGEGANQAPYFNYPTLKLHCGRCETEMFFAAGPAKVPVSSHYRQEFMGYTCKNCERFVKVIAVRVRKDDAGRQHALKYGETPPFGPPLPARLLKLVGDDATLLKKGRQAENQGLGIGAYGYYRRVVESQKGALIAELINAAHAAELAPAVIKSLEEVADERSFTRAVEALGPAFPAQLLIGGHHNPFTLLHNFLSGGLHELDDHECLEKATAVREVLTEVVERMQRLREDRGNLHQAIRQLSAGGESGETEN